MTPRTRRAGIVAACAALAIACTALPVRASHTISLTVEPRNGVWGTTFIFRGFTSANTQVKLQRRFIGSTAWRDVSGQPKTTNSNGYYWFSDEPIAGADYRGVVVSDGATSPAVRVEVRVGVRIAVGRSGERALFTGRVLPEHPGTRVILQMYDGANRRWNNVASGRLSSTSSYRIAYKATDNGRRLFRVAWPTQDRNHLWNLSAEAFVEWVSS